MSELSDAVNALLDALPGDRDNVSQVNVNRDGAIRIFGVDRSAQTVKWG